MKKILRIIALVILGALVIGTFVYLWQKSRPKKVEYELCSPEIKSIQKQTIATGKVEPRDEVAIVPQISGIVSALYKQAGDMVKEGDVIALIQVIPEMGSLNAAEAQVKKANLNLEQSQREYDRTKKLYEAKVVVKEDFEKMETVLNIARQDAQSAQDNLEIVRDGIAKRSTGVSNTKVRSTITGMILDVPIKVGNSVIQANTFNAGTTIASVADMSDMIFRGTIDETEVGKIREGMKLDITIGALQDQHFDADLEYISPKSQEDNGAILFEIKAAVNIPEDSFIRAGYSANAKIILDSRENVLCIPESALAFENEKPFVYIYTNEDQKQQYFEKRAVSLGLSNGIDVEITEGITESDRVRGLKKN